MVLLGGVLCGALVPFANTVFFVEPERLTTYERQDIVRTSRLKVNDTLLSTTGYLADQPFAPLVASRRFRTGLPTWTSDEYAFESFNVTFSDGRPQLNATIPAETLGFSADLDCGSVEYSTTVLVPWKSPTALKGASVAYNQTTLLLSPSSSDMIRTGCKMSLADFPVISFRAPFESDKRVPPAAWLNSTTCADTKEPRLLITVLELLDSKATGFGVLYRTAGLVCRPKYQSQIVKVLVNATSASLLDTQSTAELPTNITIWNNITELLPLINPYAVQDIFLEERTTLIESAALMENKSVQDRTTNSVGIDPWFYMLSRGEMSTISGYTSIVLRL